MGLFRRRKKKEDEIVRFDWMTIGEAMARSKMKNGQVGFEDFKDRCKECCEQYVDAKDRLETVKHEYDAVNSYLADLQKVDELPAEQHKELEEIARAMVTLNDERVRYQESERERITPVQFRQMERYEDEVPEALKNLEQQEQYRDTVNEDIRQLEGEKGALAYEKEQENGRLKFLKNLSVISVAMICLLFMVLFYLSNLLGTDLTMAFLLTGILALALAAYIISSIRKARYSIATAEAKTNKAIFLMNKVKIKYVNSTNAIDYVYEKYGINSRYELSYLWDQYLKVKSDRERYRKNTELLENYNKSLIACLQRFDIRDAEVWIYQPEAILSKKEMVEVRHHLNERRRAVHDRMDYLSKHFELADSELVGLRDYFPQYEEDIKKMMLKYKICED